MQKDQRRLLIKIPTRRTLEWSTGNILKIIEGRIFRA